MYECVSVGEEGACLRAQPQGALIRALSLNIKNFTSTLLLKNNNVFISNKNVFLSKSSSKRNIPASWYLLKQNYFYCGTKPILLGLPKAMWMCRCQVQEATDRNGRLYLCHNTQESIKCTFLMLIDSYTVSQHD